MADEVYTWGIYKDEESRDVVYFTQEVIGIYFIPDNDPDFEGISFLLEDGSIERIGRESNDDPSITDFMMLQGRLIGLSVKFARNIDEKMDAPT